MVSQLNIINSIQCHSWTQSI